MTTVDTEPLMGAAIECSTMKFILLSAAWTTATAAGEVAGGDGVFFTSTAGGSAILAPPLASLAALLAATLTAALGPPRTDAVVAVAVVSVAAPVPDTGGLLEKADGGRNWARSCSQLGLFFMTAWQIW